MSFGIATSFCFFFFLGWRNCPYGPGWTFLVFMVERERESFLRKRRSWWVCDCDLWGKEDSHFHVIRRERASVEAELIASPECHVALHWPEMGASHYCSSIFKYYIIRAGVFGKWGTWPPALTWSETNNLFSNNGNISVSCTDLTKKYVGFTTLFLLFTFTPSSGAVCHRVFLFIYFIIMNL